MCLLLKYKAETSSGPGDTHSTGGALEKKFLFAQEFRKAFMWQIVKKELLLDVARRDVFKTGEEEKIVFAGCGV